MLRQVKECHKTVLEVIRGSEVLSKCYLHEPDAAFYFFANVRHYLHTFVEREDGEIIHIENDNDLALYLLLEARVVTIPGSAFLFPGHLRIAYALYVISLLW